MLSSILFPSVAKSVAKLKRTPVVVVSSNGSVQHYGCGERAGEVETWDGGCALQVIMSTSLPLQHLIGRAHTRAYYALGWCAWSRGKHLQAMPLAPK